VGQKKHQITQVKFVEDAINRIAVMPVKACPGRDPDRYPEVFAIQNSGMQRGF
jgi:hypothetical protein